MSIIAALIRKNITIALKNKFISFVELFFPLLTILFLSIFNLQLIGKSVPKGSFHMNETSISSRTNYQHFDLSSFFNNQPFAFIAKDMELFNRIENAMRNNKLVTIKRYKDINSYFIDNGQLDKDKNAISISQGFVFSISKENKIQIQLFVNNSNAFRDMDYIYKQKSQLSSIPCIQNDSQVIQMQLYLYHLFIKRSNVDDDINFTLYPLPSKPIMNNIPYGLYHKIIFSIISLSFISIIIKFTFWIIEENESKILMLLTRLGVTYKQYITSWLLSYCILTIPPLFSSTFALNWLFFDKKMLMHCIGMLVILFADIWMVIICLSTYFNKQDNTLSIIISVYVGLEVIGIIIDSNETNQVFKYLFLLYPQFSIKKWMEILFLCSNHQTILTRPFYYEYNKLSLEAIIYGLFWSISLKILIYISLNSLDLNCSSLFLSIFYWVFRSKRPTKEIVLSNDLFFFNNLSSSMNEFNPSFSIKNYEEINTAELKEEINQRTLLEVNYLNKRYGTFSAIKDVSFKFCPGKIFVLLGANGAGKTTLLKLLAGIEEANFGDIILFGNSFKDNPDYLLKNIGYCPQEDIFIKDLSVEDHLNLIKEIKGISNEAYKDIIFKLQLIKCRAVLSQKLTEGSRQRLSLAMSLIGNSKLMLLDEPTNGLDYQSKRRIWKYLKNNKQNKIIIITTHEFEEAEYLADTIGIMEEGELICLGSSSYLKNKYPCGFNISFIFNNSQSVKSASLEEKGKLIAEMKAIEPNVKIIIMGKRYIKLNFPNKGSNQNKIQAIFDRIERIKALFDLVDYTISTASLEDVFLKINDNEFTRNLFEKEIQHFIGDVSVMPYGSMLANHSDLANYDSDSIDMSFFLDEDSIQPTPQQEVSKYFTKERNPFESNYLNNDSFFNEVNANNIKERSQMLRHLKRLFILLYRNKSDYLTHLFYSGIIFLLILLFAKTSSIRNSSVSLHFNDMSSILDNEVVYYQMNQGVNKQHNISDVFLDSNINTTYTLIEKTYPLAVNDISSKAFAEDLYNKWNTSELKIFLLVKNLRNYVLFYSPINPSFKYPLLNEILSSLLYKKHSISTDLLVGVSHSTSMNEHIQEDDRMYIFEFDNYIMLIAVISLIIYNSNMITIPIHERLNETKHLNYLNGGSQFSYWLSLFVFDYIQLSIFITIIYLFSFRIDYLINTIVLPFIWGFSSINYTYLFSFAFDNKKYAWLFFTLINIFITLFVYIFEYTLHIPYDSNTKLSSMCYISLSDINPFTAFSRHFILIFKALSYKKSNNFFLTYYYYNAYFIFFIQTLVFVIILICFENKYFQFLVLKLSHSCKRRNRTAKVYARIHSSAIYAKLTTLSEAMQNEKKKIERSNRLPIVINNLNVFHKNFLYESTIGVYNIYLGLEENESFGLLGKNGSGKSTLIRSIIQDFTNTHGNIKIFNRDLKEEFNKVRLNLGYCPQGNALYDYLTVKETFEYYLRTNLNINEVIRVFGLSKYEHVLTANLSGGNKRKLIFAIALMNNPQLLLLDEPSKGIDPDSRRLMWKNITELNRLKKNMKKNFNLIISTHSFEEAEILCDNIGWMNKGTISVIGNSEELKLKYSKGYFLTLKFTKPSQEQLNELVLPIQFNAITLFDNLTIGNISDFVSRQNEPKKQLEYYYYFYKLNEIIEMINDCLLKLHFIRRNQSTFVIMMTINKHKQYYLFSTLLQLKYYDKEISELSIDLEPLNNFIDTI